MRVRVWTRREIPVDRIARNALQARFREKRNKVKKSRHNITWTDTDGQ